MAGAPEKSAVPLAANWDKETAPSLLALSAQSSSGQATSPKAPDDGAPATTTTPPTNTMIPEAVATKSTQSMGKFKEKRPEPLKLNPNPNQEIPLDLSVKSAGNVPSGTLGNIFNLSNVSAQMTTLETPRIIWQDNEALLMKPRLFSSSALAGGQRATRLSLVGDSPPITPNTPTLQDLIGCSPAVSRSAASLSQLAAGPLSSTSHLSSSSGCSLQAFVAGQFQLSPGQRAPSGRFLSQLRDAAVAAAATTAAGDIFTKSPTVNSCQPPRRSCSTESIRTLTATGGGQQGRRQRYADSNNSHKLTISPLATKNLSSGSLVNQTTRFSYNSSNLPVSSTANSCNRSPNFMLAGEALVLSSESSPNATNKALTPTSLANATANLLNIHLNSPTNSQHQQTTFSLGADVVMEHEQQQRQNFNHLMDPLLSAAYCSSQKLGLKGSSSSSSIADANPLEQPAETHPRLSGQLGSLSSSLGAGTLDTPTLISPRQLKGGPLSFLPSPTLSPMSSVFELPSPLLMFPAASFASEQQVSSKNKAQVSSSCGKASSDISLASEPNGSMQPPPIADKGSSETDLSHLVTSARHKSGSGAQLMLADDQHRQVDADQLELAMDVEPDKSIPRILVHEHEFERRACVCSPDQSGDRVRRESLGKRALSPQSFRQRVHLYHSERLESSSAPPSVYEGRARPKLKSAAGNSSCVEVPRYEQYYTPAAPQVAQLTSRQQQPPSLVHHSASYHPYLPEGRWLPPGGHINGRPISGQRPSSAEPIRSSYSAGACLASLPCADCQFSLSAHQLAGAQSCCSSSSSVELQQQQQQQQQPQPPQILFAPACQAQLCQPPRSLTNVHDNGQYQPLIQRANQPATGCNQSALVRAGAPANGNHNNGHLHQHHSSSSSLVDGLLNQTHLYEVAQSAQSQQVEQSHSQRAIWEPAAIGRGQTTQAGQPPQQQQLYSLGRAMSALGPTAPQQAGEPAVRSASANSASVAAKKYHCDQCSKTFTRSDMLTRHKRLHSGDRPFQCSECKQEFSRSDHLSTHMRTHTGEKPYRCKLCAYSACRKDMITRHMKAHNRSSPVKAGAALTR